MIRSQPPMEIKSDAIDMDMFWTKRLDIWREQARHVVCIMVSVLVLET